MSHLSYFILCLHTSSVLNLVKIPQVHGFGMNLMKVPDEDEAEIICTLALLRKYYISGESLSGAVLSMSLTSATLRTQENLLKAIHAHADFPWTVTVKDIRRAQPITLSLILHEKPQCYFVVIENLEDEDLDAIFVEWKTNINWNPIAQFVVYMAAVEETEEEMTELMIEVLLSFMNKKIYNVNVIGQNEENGFFYGKSVFPYHPDNNCGNRVISIETLDICDYQNRVSGGTNDEYDDETNDDEDYADEGDSEYEGEGEEEKGGHDEANAEGSQDEYEANMDEENNDEEAEQNEKENDEQDEATEVQDTNAEEDNGNRDVGDDASKDEAKNDDENSNNDQDVEGTDNDEEGNEGSRDNDANNDDFEEKSQEGNEHSVQEEDGSTKDEDKNKNNKDENEKEVKNDTDNINAVNELRSDNENSDYDDNSDKIINEDGNDKSKENQGNETDGNVDGSVIVLQEANAEENQSKEKNYDEESNDKNEILDACNKKQQSGNIGDDINTDEEVDEEEIGHGNDEADAYSAAYQVEQKINCFRMEEINPNGEILKREASTIRKDKLERKEKRAIQSSDNEDEKNNDKDGEADIDDNLENNDENVDELDDKNEKENILPENEKNMEKFDGNEEDNNIKNSEEDQENISKVDDKDVGNNEKQEEDTGNANGDEVNQSNENEENNAKVDDKADNAKSDNNEEDARNTSKIEPEVENSDNVADSKEDTNAGDVDDSNTPDNNNDNDYDGDAKDVQNEAENKTSVKQPKFYLEELCRGLFLDKFPKDLSGCPLIAAYRPWEPYIFAEASAKVEGADDGYSYRVEQLEDSVDDYQDESSEPEVKLYGIEYEMVQIIGQVLHMSVNIQQHSSNMYHFFQQLIDGDIEMVFGGIDEDPNLSQYVSSTIPYHQDDLTWCVAKAKQQHSLFNFLKSFTVGSWLLIQGYIMAAFICVWLAQRLLKVSLQHLRGPFLIWLRIYGISLTQSIQLREMPVSVRIAMAVTFYMGFLFTNIYQSILVSTLTTPKSSHQISHLKEIYRYRMTVMGSVENVRHLNKGGEVYKYVREKFQICYNIEECLQQAATNERLAVAIARQHSFYNPRIPREQLYCFDRDENIYVYLVTMLLPKKFHLLHKINPIIQHVIESGHIQKWARDLDRKRKIIDEINRTHEDPFKPLTLVEVSGSFVFAGMVLLCASMVFLLERCVYWLVIKRRTRLKIAKFLHRKLK